MAFKCLLIVALKLFHHSEISLALFCLWFLSLKVIFSCVGVVAAVEVVVVVVVVAAVTAISNRRFVAKVKATRLPTLSQRRRRRRRRCQH